MSWDTIYQPPSDRSQLRLIYEVDEKGGLQLGYFYKNQPSSPSQLDIRNGFIYRIYQMFINVETGEVMLLYSMHL